MAKTGSRPDQRSAEAHEYRRLYRTARWRRVREAQLSANPLCAMCLEGGRVTPATVCDHVDKDSKADAATFFGGPFRSLCAPCHDSAAQRDERRADAGKLPIRRCGADGWPI